MDSLALKVSGVQKRFGAVTALRDLSLKVQDGEIHGLVGHNGSGKSTLVKLLAGNYVPDSGTIAVRGRELRFPRDAGWLPGNKFAVVHQDLGIAPSMPIVDNFRVNRYRRGQLRFIRWRDEFELTRERLAALGVRVDPRAKTEQLNPSERVLLCVARALADLDAMRLERPEAGGILILDEPTSTLPADKVEMFLEIIRSLPRTSGSTVLFVSHNPREIMAVSDRFSALRNGSRIGTFVTGEVSYEQLALLMAGQVENGRSDVGGGATATGKVQAGPVAKQDVSLDVKGLSGTRIHSLTFHVARGEVLGLTGLVGSGYEDVPYLLCGALKRRNGRILVGGRVLSREGPEAFRAAGGLLLAADRTRTSGIPVATARENMTLGNWPGFVHGSVIKHREERAAVRAMLARLRVRPPDPERRLALLSGGQQQKVLIGRCLLQGSDVLVVHEPTAAIDVGAREEIRAALRDFAAEGKAVLVVSCQYEELPMLCDRIVVVTGGRLAGELTAGKVTEEEILKLCYSKMSVMT